MAETYHPGCGCVFLGSHLLHMQPCQDAIEVGSYWATERQSVAQRREGTRSDAKRREAQAKAKMPNGSIYPDRN